MYTTFNTGVYENATWFIEVRCLNLLVNFAVKWDTFAFVGHFAFADYRERAPIGATLSPTIMRLWTWTRNHLLLTCRPTHRLEAKSNLKSDILQHYSHTSKLSFHESHRKHDITPYSFKMPFSKHDVVSPTVLCNSGLPPYSGFWVELGLPRPLGCGCRLLKPFIHCQGQQLRPFGPNSRRHRDRNWL